MKGYYYKYDEDREQFAICRPDGFVLFYASEEADAKEYVRKLNS